MKNRIREHAGEWVLRSTLGARLLAEKWHPIRVDFVEIAHLS